MVNTNHLQKYQEIKKQNMCKKMIKKKKKGKNDKKKTALHTHRKIIYTQK